VPREAMHNLAKVYVKQMAEADRRPKCPYQLFGKCSHQGRHPTISVLLKEDEGLFHSQDARCSRLSSSCRVL
jgi:hypothetical protein